MDERELMRDLRLIGVHDDGEHLVVTDDTGEEYRLRIDDPLRAAARRDRPRLGQLQIAIDNNVRPREVQAMIRAGATADEVAARTGWDLDKISRFEGPVLAEREHIATRAQGVRMRGTNQAGSPETLGQRAATRLAGRGVEPSSVLWDAYRDTEGQWTVSAMFAAGGRERTATWWFDQAGMSVVAKNDEAKWLSEADAPSGPVPTAVHRPTAVFDVEVEEKTAERATRANTDDLINSMREHSGAKSRRRGGRRKTKATGDRDALATEDALPLEELPPPARGTHPQDEVTDAPQQEPEVVAPKAEPAAAAPTAAAPEAAAPKAAQPAVAKAASPSAAETAPAKGTAAVAATGAATEGSAPKSMTAQPTTAPAAEMKAEPEVTTEPDMAQKSAVATDQSDVLDAQDDVDPASEGEDSVDADSSDQDSSARARGRKGRAKVPSWDDVMFGTTRD